MKAFRRRAPLLGVGLAAALVAAGPVLTGADPVLRTLEDELARSMKGLGEKGDPPPYFLSYHLTDVRTDQLSASYGAMRDRESQRVRLLDVDVRVGDYRLDSLHRTRGERGGSGFHRPVRVALGDDPGAVRATLWLETDRRYKEAVERLIQVRTQQAVKVKEEDDSDDFSREEPFEYVGPPAEFRLEKGRWEKRLREFSGLLDDSPRIYQSGVDLTAEARTRYFVSSEGARVQEGTTHYRLALYAATRAEDGMDLYRYEFFDSHSAEGLPDDRTVRRRIERMVRDLLSLRDAPVVEPYSGPAILEGRAAGVFFHEIFGHRIEGHRQKDEEEGQTFTKKVNEQVLPTFLSVYDDPTLEHVGGTDLAGHYVVDDEGVPARRVPVVERGVLRNFLMSRSPVAGFARSNGHGRKSPGFDAVGRQGSLVVETLGAVSEARLREMLLEECRKQGKPFGLIFREISGGFTFTGRGIPQAYQVTPILVYRVFTDGRPDQLIRGADLIGTPLASFDKILAASDEVEVFNGYCGAESGWIPVSALSPSILTAEIEVQKKVKAHERPPLLPPPQKKERG